MRGISTERHTLCPSEVRGFGENIRRCGQFCGQGCGQQGDNCGEHVQKVDKTGFPKRKLPSDEAGSSVGKRKKAQRTENGIFVQTAQT